MKLIILDRDGVINHDSADYIKSPEEWIPIQHSLEAISRLNQAGFLVVVASNQSGLARGLFSIADLNAIHHKMHESLARLGGHLDGIFYCPHGPDDNCNCRKPRPGLFLQIADRLGIDITGAYVIGDSLRDLEAALSVDAHPILVLTGNGRETQLKLKEKDVIPVHENLRQVVDALISMHSAGSKCR